MIDIEEINKKIQGWGLQLNDAEIKKLLEHLLWECQNAIEFSERCMFIFDGPVMSVVWNKAKRSVTIYDDLYGSISVSA